MERYFDTVDSIARSPGVKQFLIGYTKRAGAPRFREHRKFEWEHLVIIADRSTYAQANALEKYLQKQRLKKPKWCTNLKYSETHRIRAFNPGKKSDRRSEKIHSVYMLW
jgi:hypothetical protein